MCVLSVQIDVENAPSIEFEIFTCESLAFTLQPNEICARIEIIELTHQSKSEDGWYLKYYNDLTSGQNYENFKLENQILYYRHDKLSSAFENKWKMCVPAEDYIKVFEEQHESILASHPGFYRTLRRIQAF